MGLFKDIVDYTAGPILGLALQDSNDKRQLRQQHKLNEVNIDAAKKMGDYNYEQQLKMWNATGYGAQKQQLKNAGLNPGLLYGMGGAGGATTGSHNNSVSGGGAPVGGNEVMGMMNMKLQQEMTKANIELAKSQANKNNVEANKTGGVDTDNALIQKKLGEFQIEIKGETLQAAIKMAKYETDKVLQELNIATNEALISQNTWDARIQTVHQELAGVIARNELTKTQTDKTEADIEQMSKQIALEYAKLANEKDKTRVQQNLQEFETSFGGQAANILRTLTDLLPMRRMNKKIINNKNIEIHKY